MHKTQNNFRNQEQPKQTFSVAISMHDLKFELDEEDNLVEPTWTKENCTCQVLLGAKVLGKFTFEEGQKENFGVKVPLTQSLSEAKIQLIIKHEDDIVGSVSIPQHIVLNGGIDTYNQWITLFEWQDDDEYDGVMGVDDDEDPMCLFRFRTTQDVPITAGSPRNVADKKKPSIRAGSPTNFKKSVSKPELKSGSPRNQPVTNDQDKEAAKAAQLASVNRLAGTKATQRPATAVSKPIKPEQLVRRASPNSLQLQKKKSDSISPDKAQKKTQLRSPSPVKDAGIDISRELKKKGHYSQWDQNWIKDLLSRKIHELSTSVINMQQKNFQVEDNVLDRLQLLKQFNEELDQASSLSENQVTDLKHQLNQRKQSHETILLHQTEIVSDLSGELRQKEEQRIEIASKAQEAEQRAKEAVIQHTERLTSTLNIENPENRENLEETREARNLQITARADTLEKLQDHVRDVQTHVKQTLNQISTFETTVGSHAKENSNLKNDIDQLKATLQGEQSSEIILKLKSEATDNEIELLEDQIQTYSELMASAKEEGEELYTELRDKISFNDDRIDEGNNELVQFGDEIRMLLQQEAGAKTDTQRLTKLKELYGALDKKLQQSTEAFFAANKQRAASREAVINIRDSLNSHLNEDVEFTVDLSEVDELCQIIEEKDKKLMLDLMKVKDQMAKRNEDSAWKASAETASSIQLDEVAFTERDIILTEQQDIKNHIEGDQKEIAKLMKIIQKYQAQAQKQDQHTKQLVSQLGLMQSQLEDLHATSINKHKQLAEQRKKSLEASALNKQKLAILYECDDKVEDRKQILNDQQTELLELKKKLAKKDGVIAKLNAKLNPHLVQGAFVAVRGDKVDETFCGVLNGMGVTLPVTRMGMNHYMFGTTKVTVSMKGKALTIRAAGGGQMAAEDFLVQNIQKEEDRCKKKNVQELNALHNGKLNLLGTSLGQGASPGRRSPMGRPSTAITATPTSRRTTATINRRSGSL